MTLPAVPTASSGGEYKALVPTTDPTHGITYDYRHEECGKYTAHKRNCRHKAIFALRCAIVNVYILTISDVTFFLFTVSYIDGCDSNNGRNAVPFASTGNK